jgi:hydrogenase nickel incorporation protein HypA/HybF
MHELALTETILNTTLRYAANGNAQRVTDVYFVVGQLSEITDESVQFYWDLISPGTICEGARLHFDHQPAQLKCRNCDHIFALPDDRIACPHCNSEHVQVISGSDFRLDSIEIANADEASLTDVGELIVEPEHQH